ncbi:hypothetical protein C5167_007835, partial [Papaver somniferum]
ENIPLQSFNTRPLSHSLSPEEKKSPAMNLSRRGNLRKLGGRFDLRFRKELLQLLLLIKYGPLLYLVFCFGFDFREV